MITQNYLVFQPIDKYFKFVNINNECYITSWHSKGLSSESIKPPTTSNNSLNPLISYYNVQKIRVKFTGSCLKQSTTSYTHKKIVNIYIVYELGASSSNDNDPTLKNCLFRAVSLIKMMILISIVILVMELDLIEDQVFHFLVVDLVKI